MSARRVPPGYLARFLAHLEAAFPGEEITAGTLEQLQPHVEQAYAAGRPARLAAASLCACDGGRIQPARCCSFIFSILPMSVALVGLIPQNWRIFRCRLLRQWARYHHRYTHAGIPIVTTTRADFPASNCCALAPAV